jgi:hypothetical protein
MKFNVDAISRAFREGSPTWAYEMTRNISSGIDAVKKGMHDGTISTKDGTREISRLVRSNLSIARDNMDSLSADGKAKLAQNFRDAANAVRDQMRRTGKVTKDGLDQVHSLLAQELQVYGFSLREARNIVKGRRYDGGPKDFTAVGDPVTGHQRGGWIGAPGMAGQDNVRIAPGVVAAMGEWHGVGKGGGVVINRHQAPIAEAALALTRAFGGKYGSLNELGQAPVDQSAYLDAAMRMLVPGGLNTLFARIRRPHYLAGGGRYPLVTGDTDFLPALGNALSRMARSTGTPIFVQSGRRSLGEQAGLAASKGVYSASNPTGAAAPSPNAPHVRGIAADITPGRSAFGGVAGRYGLGFTVPTEPWHIQLLNAAAAGDPVAIQLLRSARITGGGAVGQLVQRALNVGVSAANQLINAAAMSSVSVGGEGGPTAAGGYSKAALESLWTGAGGPPGLANLAAAIALAESGGDPNAHNPSGATGLWQILGAVLPGNLYDPVVNAANAVKKWRDAHGFTPWVTYTHGDYQAYLAPGGFYTDPVTNAGNSALSMGNLLAGAGSAAVGAGEGAITLRVLNRRVNDRVSDYDDMETRLADDQRTYGQMDRRFGLSQEVFVDPKTGEVNQSAVKHRVGELDKLVAMRRKIVRELQAMLHRIRVIVSTYRTIIRRLEGSLQYAKKKNRAGIRQQIADYRSKLADWQGKLHDLPFDITDAKLDVRDVLGERATVLGTQPETQAAAADTSPSADATAQAQQAITSATSLAADLAAARAAITAFGSSGDIGTAQGPNALASATGGQLGGGRGGNNAVAQFGGPTVADAMRAAGLPVHAAMEGIPAGGGVTYVVAPQIASFVPPTGQDMARMTSAVVSSLDAAPTRPATTIKVG